jgi:hypothetical protein
MAKLLISTKIYLWPKDEETGETTYSLYTDKEYEEACEEYGVESLDDTYLDYDEIVDKLHASEDSYSASGESLTVLEIPDADYDEVKALFDLKHETEKKINNLYHKFGK